MEDEDSKLRRLRLLTHPRTAQDKKSEWKCWNAGTINVSYSASSPSKPSHGICSDEKDVQLDRYRRFSGSSVVGCCTTHFGGAATQVPRRLGIGASSLALSCCPSSESSSVRRGAKIGHCSSSSAQFRIIFGRRSSPRHATMGIVKVLPVTIIIDCFKA